MSNFLPKFNIHKENDFNEKNMSSIPIGNNNISIQKQNIDLKTDSINNIKPMLGNSNKIHIPEGTKIKIKPSLKKVPNDTFSMMANQKKSGLSSAENSDDETLENEILSNASGSSNINFDDNDENEEIFSNNSDNFEENEDDDEDDDDVDNNEGDEEYEDEDDEQSFVAEKKTMSYEEIQQEKQKLLFNLDRLQKQGYPPSKKYSMASSYDDLNYEHERLKKQRDVEKSIKFSRKILMAFTSGIEFLNNRFDPLDLKLDGWSENMMENVNDYDEVFEELHDKYGESVKMAPELKLISMVAGSGFMFHLTNSLFKSATPDLKDILKQNPDIMKNISEAAAKNMNQNIDDRFGPNDSIGNMMKSGINNKVSSMPGQHTMSGPKGIDDLIGELNDDNASVSSEESINMSSSSNRKARRNKKGGISLNL
tara:strand:+ start:582 stop:1856 length:1275 start_codon:yes stop_codon:yes gene_type:complete